MKYFYVYFEALFAMFFFINDILCLLLPSVKCCSRHSLLGKKLWLRQNIAFWGIDCSISTRIS